MKKILVVFLSAAFFTACNNDDTTKTETKTDSTDTSHPAISIKVDTSNKTIKDVKEAFDTAKSKVSKAAQTIKNGADSLKVEIKEKK